MRSYLPFILLSCLLAPACAGGEEETGGDTAAPAVASTEWYIGTSDGQTPDGSYVAPTEEVLFIRALDPDASTVTEQAWTVGEQGVTAYELVHDVDAAAGTFTSTFVTDEGTMLVEGAYDAGAAWAWTAWHSTSIYQDGEYQGIRVESQDHVEDSGVAIAEKLVYDATDTLTYEIVEELTPVLQEDFETRLAEVGG